MFWTSLVLRLELLPFDFSLGFILFELFSQTYLGRRVELTTFLIVNLLCFCNANIEESRARTTIEGSCVWWSWKHYRAEPQRWLMARRHDTTCGGEAWRRVGGALTWHLRCACWTDLLVPSGRISCRTWTFSWTLTLGRQRHRIPKPNHLLFFKLIIVFNLYWSIFLIQTIFYSCMHIKLSCTIPSLKK